MSVGSASGCQTGVSRGASHAGWAAATRCIRDAGGHSIATPFPRFQRSTALRSDLYVTLDPNSIKRAEEAAARELYAQSAILSVHRQSAEEIAREEAA